MRIIFIVALLTACRITAAVAAVNIWSHENLHAWSVAPFDASERTPEERAQMLGRLGLKSYAYSWRERHIPSFDAEIEAMQRHGIRIIAWNFLSVEPGDPPAQAALAAFRRHGIHPQWWIMQSRVGAPKSLADWAKYLPPGTALPESTEALEKLPEPEKAAARELLRQARLRFQADSLTKTPAEQNARVRQEADRINAIAAQAAAYGCKVALYPHNSWFGQMDNLVAIIKRLKELGRTDVGIVYNFNHARDELHDDTKNFPAVWRMIQPYVVAVNITGLRWEGQLVYPSQGDSELEMMRTIQESGWQGPVGIIAEKGGDAETTLRNYLRGLDWLAAEINRPGSGGPRPFPPIP